MPEEVDEDEQEFVEVNVTINEEDQILFDALNSIDEQDRAHTLLRWARVGHLVSGLVEVEANKATLKDYFPELEHVADDLKEALDDHLDEFRTKSMGQLGNIGENFVLAELESAFQQTGDHFSTIASTGHEADLRGAFLGSGGDKVEVLIEVKNYTTPVPSNQVTKFRSDIVNNRDRIKAAIFISLKTDILTISPQGKPLHFEEVDGIPTVYITQGEPSQRMFLVVWAMLRRELGGLDGTVPHADRITVAAAARLRDFVNEFNNDMVSLARLTAELRNSAQGLRNSADDLILKALEIEVEARGKGNSFRRLIEAEALGLATAGALLPPHQLISYDEFEKKWIETAIAEDKLAKHRPNLERLHLWLNYGDDLELEWDSDNDSLKIMQGGIEMVTIKGMANDLRITPTQEAIDRVDVKVMDAGITAGEEILAKGQRNATLPSWMVLTFYGDDLVTEPLSESPPEETNEEE